ncbi:hypothetical protein SH668x_000246 [Planctomicrobium sp. SH668]|uniref:hypothetical protein n=1 Tax=Planctomicrobium sp. SH668 TaxID=3448126 RepID=UPI003F5B8794
MNDRTGSSPEAKFWNWFSKNAEEYRVISDDDRDAAFDKLHSHLYECHPELAIEVSPTDASGVNELTITSEGNIELFPLVEQIVAMAPAMQGWRVVAFRQPIDQDFVFESDGIRLDTQELQFRLEESFDDPGLVDLIIAVPNLDDADEDALETGVIILLESRLGEKVAAESIATLEVIDASMVTKRSGFQPFSELSPAIHEFRQSLNNSTEM